MLKEKELRNFRENTRCVNNMRLTDVKAAIESKARI